MSSSGSGSRLAAWPKSIERTPLAAADPTRGMQSNAECPIARMRSSPRPTLGPWPLAGGRAATACLKTSWRHRGSRSSRRRFRGRRHRYRRGPKKPRAPPVPRLIGHDEAPLHMRIRIWVATALITSGLWATWLAPANASIEALFAPSKDLWPRWTTHDERSRQVVDHSAFDRLLGRYLSLDSTGVARFAYGRVTPDDRAALRGYLNALAAIRASGLSRQEQP